MLSDHSHMAPSQVDKAWDFSSVYSLLNTLSKENIPSSTGQSSTDNHIAQHSTHDSPLQNGRATTLRPSIPKRGVSNGLGDFSQIWQYLGTPISSAVNGSVPPPTTSPRLDQRVPEKIEYTSDGALYAMPASAKKLQWRDEVNEGTLTDVAPTHSDEGPKLSKKQRKKLNRRKRMDMMESTRRAVSDMESEAEMPETPRNPAAKASVHSLSAENRRKYNLRPRNVDGKVSTPQSSPEQPKRKSPPQHENVVAVPTSDRTKIPQASKPQDTAILQQVADSGRAFLARYNSEPPETKPEPRIEKVVRKEWPVSNPYSAQALAFLPSSVKPDRKTHTPTKPLKPDPIEQESSPSIRNNVPTRQIITPKIIRSGEDRHWAFLLKLINDFWEDRGSLIKPANLSTHSNDPTGIHVFVDASNIFIGFHDQLKKARGIPPHARVPRVDMSFDALSLLMERRRPVAKRVLAGSTPHLSAFDTAKAIGYDCAILDKVYKARELTERQRYFLGEEARMTQRRMRKREPAAGSGANSSGNGYASEGGYTSGGSSAGSADGGHGAVEIPTHAPEKFVEQGVDEILHLKMMESVVDADETRPPTTIVLATGDAAQAEYSGGFMQMVERALGKGWTVELVSWSANISGMYKRPEFRKKWGKKFRIVELDDYAEELLDM